MLIGKTNGLDHSWSVYFDHPWSELYACCLAMYVNCNLTGEKWSISPAFASTQRFELFSAILN